MSEGQFDIRHSGPAIDILAVTVILPTVVSGCSHPQWLSINIMGPCDSCGIGWLPRLLAWSGHAVVSRARGFARHRIQNASLQYQARAFVQNDSVFHPYLRNPSP